MRAAAQPLVDAATTCNVALSGEACCGCLLSWCLSQLPHVLSFNTLHPLYCFDVRICESILLRSSDSGTFAPHVCLRELGRRTCTTNMLQALTARLPWHPLHFSTNASLLLCFLCLGFSSSSVSLRRLPSSALTLSCACLLFLHGCHGFVTRMRWSGPGDAS